MKWLLLLLSCTACNLPRDSDGTLDRIRGGTMRVGVVVDTPWTTDSAGTVGGIEGGMAQSLARSLNANVEWVRGQPDELLAALKKRKLDLVIAGLTSKSPWSKQVAFTRPYVVDTVPLPGAHQPTPREHVLATSPGENAWLMYVERMLMEARSRVREQLRLSAR